MKMESIRACSIWRALEIVGDAPVLLILEQCFLGISTFEAFVEQTGLPRSVVAARLRKLVADDCLARVSPERSRRAGYRLTAKGRELFPVALMMLRWQHRWPSGSRGYVVNLTHHACGKASEPVPACSHCRAEVDPREVSWREGPGIAQVAPLYERRRSPSAALDGKRDKIVLADTVIRIFGDRWATLVIRALFTGIHRFDEIRRDTLMATNILSGRIEMLIGLGVIKAVPYSDHPDRHEYRLTAKGRDIYPILLGLLQWGDAWYADERGPPLLLSHRPCDHDLVMEVTCSACGEAMDLNGTAMQVAADTAD